MSEVKLNELTKSLSSTLSMSEERSGRFVDSLVNSVRTALAASKDVSLPGFGNLSLTSADGKPVPSMYKANILGDICAQLSESNQQRVQSTMDTVLEAVKKELLGGKRVVLDDLGIFEVRSEKPEIERQPKGHRLIKPALAAVTFASPSTIKTAAGEAKVVFSPSDDL